MKKKGFVLMNDPWMYFSVLRCRESGGSRTDLAPRDRGMLWHQASHSICFCVRAVLWKAGVNLAGGTR